jgi:hypothetical protein
MLAQIMLTILGSIINMIGYNHSMSTRMFTLTMHAKFIGALNYDENGFGHDLELAIISH